MEKAKAILSTTSLTLLLSATLVGLKIPPVLQTGSALVTTLALGLCAVTLAAPLVMALDERQMLKDHRPNPYTFPRLMLNLLLLFWSAVSTATL